jgi:hypothetical protein
MQLPVHVDAPLLALPAVLQYMHMAASALVSPFTVILLSLLCFFIQYYHPTFVPPSPSPSPSPLPPGSLSVLNITALGEHFIQSKDSQKCGPPL